MSPAVIVYKTKWVQTVFFSHSSVLIQLYSEMRTLFLQQNSASLTLDVGPYFDKVLLHLMRMMVTHQPLQSNLIKHCMVVVGFHDEARKVTVTSVLVRHPVTWSVSVEMRWSGTTCGLVMTWHCSTLVWVRWLWLWCPWRHFTNVNIRGTKTQNSID